MGIIKRRNAYEISVYDPSIGRKRYVGRRKLERDAKQLFMDKTAEFRKQTPATSTIRAYAELWIRDHHGPNTRRPKESTRVLNEQNLRPFLAEFGDRGMDGISRREALSWSRSRHHNAKTVSAMFNDAIDEEVCGANPFANRRHKRSKERKGIAPITETELETIARIALEHYGPDGYGIVARAWVLFAAWVGCRPGETFSVALRDVDIPGGLVTVKRVKPPYSTDTVVLARAAGDALIDAMPHLAKEGPMFRTVTGRLMTGHNPANYWQPVRDKFEAKTDPERWAALLGGQDTFDFYSMRHFCASIIVERGGNEYDGSKQLGNTPEVFRETYLHEYADRVLERNRRLLDQPAVVDLDAARRRKGA